MLMNGHYDSKVDIAWFRFKTGPAPSVHRSDEEEWGLVDRDEQGRVVGLEFWKASERLPAELLDALPEPSKERVGSP